MKYFVTMEEYGQLLFIFTNFAISGIFCNIFARIYFRQWCLLTFFTEFYFREKGKKLRNLGILIPQINLVKVCVLTSNE